MKEACGNCHFGLDTGLFDEALCRRHAPVVVPIISTNRYEAAKSEWPKMSARDGWCGDYCKRHDDIHRPLDEGHEPQSRPEGGQ